MTERFDVVVLGAGPGGYVPAFPFTANGKAHGLGEPTLPEAFKRPSTDWPDR